MISDADYEKLRNSCIDAYRVLYKDSLCFDSCKVPKEVRVRLLQDKIYIEETKALKARLFSEQLEILDHVLAGTYQGKKDTDMSGTVLKALEMKNKLLLEDLNITHDDSNSLNVAFVAMTEKDFEECSTVEIFEGSNSSESLGADFGSGDAEGDSFESRMKAKTEEKLKELENGSADINK